MLHGMVCYHAEPYKCKRCLSGETAPYGCDENCDALEKRCGDGYCVRGESCENCAADCGACPPNQVRSTKCTKHNFHSGFRGCPPGYQDVAGVCWQHCNTVHAGYHPFIDCGGLSALECAAHPSVCSDTAKALTLPWVEFITGFGLKQATSMPLQQSSTVRGQVSKYRSGASVDAFVMVFQAGVELGLLLRGLKDMASNTCPH